MLTLIVYRQTYFPPWQQRISELFIILLVERMTVDMLIQHVIPGYIHRGAGDLLHHTNHHHCASGHDEGYEPAQESPHHLQLHQIPPWWVGTPRKSQNNTTDKHIHSLHWFVLNHHHNICLLHPKIPFIYSDSSVSDGNINTYTALGMNCGRVCVCTPMRACVCVCVCVCVCTTCIHVVVTMQDLHWPEARQSYQPAAAFQVSFTARTDEVMSWDVSGSLFLVTRLMKHQLECFPCTHDCMCIQAQSSSQSPEAARTFAWPAAGGPHTVSHWSLSWCPYLYITLSGAVLHTWQQFYCSINTHIAW